VQIDRTIAKGQLVRCGPFMQDNVAASQTDVQLLIAEVASAAGNAIAGEIVSFAGEITAISWLLSAAGTAGVFTIGPTVGGTEKTALTQTVGTAASGTAKVPRGTIPLAVGDAVGVEITTDGSWDGTSSDLAVWVDVLLYLDGI